MRTINILIYTAASAKALVLCSPCLQQHVKLQSVMRQQSLPLHLPKKGSLDCILVDGTCRCVALTGTKNENDFGQGDLPNLSDADEFDEETLAEIEAGQPSEWMVMKEVSF